MKVEKSSTIVPLKDGHGPLKRYQYLSDVADVFDIRNRQEATLHVVVLADDLHPANVVQDHIKSISELSDHVCTVVNPRIFKTPAALQFTRMDAVLLHYSIFALSDNYLSPEWKTFLREFSGVKAMIHEDEYQQIIRFRDFMAYAGINAVFSCLDSPEKLQKVYGVPELAKTSFFSCLAGYIPDYFDQLSGPKQSKRKTHIVYRGRTLPPQLGKLAQEKRLIGDRVAELAEEEGLKYDISSDESDRIYGPAWNRFLQKGRAMIGVEGGASIFDFDGSLAASVDAYRAEHPEADFDEIWAEVLAEHEGNINFRTITPKFFEAIASRTALVLYPGEYGGVLEAGRHYIELARDGSNFAEVAEKLRDAKFMQALVDQTHEEIMGRPELRTRYYVNKIDQVLLRLFLEANPDGSTSGKVVGTPGRPVRADLILSGPAAVLRQQITRAEERVTDIGNRVRSFDDSQISALQNVNKVLDEQIKALQIELGTLRDSVHPQFDALQIELGTLRDSVHPQFEALQIELGTLRENVHPKFKAVAEREAEIAAELEALRVQQAAHQKSIDEALTAYRDQDLALNDGLAGLRKIVESEREQIRQDLEKIESRNADTVQDVLKRLEGVDGHAERISSVETARSVLEAADAALQAGLSEADSKITALQSTIESMSDRSTHLADAEQDIRNQLTNLMQINEGVQGQLKLLAGNDEGFQAQINAFAQADTAIREEVTALDQRLSAEVSKLQAAGEAVQSGLNGLQEQIGTIQVQIGQFEGADTGLRANVTALTETSEALKTDLSGVQAQLGQFEAADTALRADLTALTETSEALKTDVSALQAQLGQFEGADTALRADVSALAETGETLKTDVSALQAQLGQFEGADTALRADVSVLAETGEALKTDVSALQAQLGQFEGADAALRADVSALAETSEALKTDLSGVQAQLGQFEGADAALRADLSALSDTSEALKTEVTEVQAQLGQFEAADTALREDIAAVTGTSEALKTEVTEVQAKLEKFEAADAAIRAELSDMSTANADMQAVHAGLAEARDELRADVTALSAANQDMLGQLSGLQTNVVSLTEISEDSRSNIASLTDTVQSVQSGLVNIETLSGEQRSRLAELEMTVGVQLKAETERSKTLRADVSSQARALARYEKALGELKSRSNDQRKEFSRTLKAAEKLSAQNQSALRRQADDIATLNETLARRIDANRDAVRDLQRDLQAGLEAFDTGQRKQIDGLRSQLEAELKALRTDLDDELREQANDQELMRLQIENLQDRDAGFDAILDIAEDRIDRLSRQQDSQQEDIAELDAAAKRFDAQITGLQQTAAVEVERLSTIAEKSDDAAAEIDRAKDRIVELERAAAHLRTQFADLQSEQKDQIDRLTDRVLRAELHAANYRRWQEEATARIEAVKSELNQELSTVQSDMVAVQDAVSSQHHIFVLWKTALKARILKVLRIRQ